MRVRLIVADLDGTLLNARREVTPRVRRAIDAAQARGVRVCIATGRIWPSARPHVEAAGADTPVILYNGGMVFDFTTGEVWMRTPLPRRHAADVLEILRRHPAVQPHLYVDDRVFVPRMTEATVEYARKDGLPVEVAGDLTALLDGDPMKILMIAPRPALEAVAAELTALPSAPNHVFSEPTYLEVLPPGINKGVALRAAAERLGIAREQVIAAGDNFNDLAMIEYAGLGVAMGNAPPDLRARADVVAPTNDEHGVAAIIERHVLHDAGAAAGAAAPAEIPHEG